MERQEVSQVPTKNVVTLKYLEAGENSGFMDFTYFSFIVNIRIRKIEICM